MVSGKNKSFGFKQKLVKVSHQYGDPRAVSLCTSKRSLNSRTF